jgi:hypothetical protein
MGAIKNKKLWITSGIVGMLLLAMTISDLYYYELSENYPVLKADELIEGRITAFKVHHKHTYVELDATKKRNIPPGFLMGSETTSFHKMIRIGDYFIHEDNSDKVTVSRGSKTYKYVVSKLLADR